MAKRIGDLLVDSGAITPEQLAAAIEAQNAGGGRLGEVLVQQGVLTDAQLATTLEHQLGIPLVSLLEEKPESRAIQLLPAEAVRRLRVLPLRLQGGRLRMAMVDPVDYYAQEEVRMLTGHAVDPVLVVQSELQAFIQQYFDLRQSLEETLQAVEAQERSVASQPEDRPDDSPVGRLLTQIISQAILQRASDVHFDPTEAAVRVRFRIDGHLRLQQTVPSTVYPMLVSRIKVLARLDITEHRIPQDGRVLMEVDRRAVDLRISVLPLLRGEKVAIRILDTQTQLKDLPALGLSPSNLDRFNRALAAQSGLILAVGPTGSGKTTTLYAALKQVAIASVNTMTIEDPVEFQMEGVNQTAVNPATGLTFAAGLRAILRQDPDIIMIGEIRDQETAEIATRAALTGHLVLSTLHTMGAVESIARLTEMGIPPYLVASSIRAVIAQRLVRRVCRACAGQRPLTAVEQAWLETRQAAERADLSPTGDRFAWPLAGDALVAVGKGCPTCAGTGYYGRLAIHEVLLVDDRLRAEILAGASEERLRKWARSHGWASLVYDGLTKVRDALTTVEEVLEVTGGYGMSTLSEP